MALVEEVRSRTVGGVARPRVDSVPKVTGAAEYTADVPLPGLLHGRLVLSPHAHAHIGSIDSEAALRVPGVVAVLTAADLSVAEGSGRAFEPLARTEVVFAGQPVALVVAESEAAAEDAVEAVLVDYEPLEAVLDVERAIEPDAPAARAGHAHDEADMAMHGDTGSGDDDVEPADLASPNVTGEHVRTQGDAGAAFAECAAVVEGRFRTPWVHQSYMEPQSVTAWVEGDGSLAIRAATQGIFFTRQHVAHVLGLPLTNVRVIGATLGGGFGGKIGLFEPLVGAAALELGRPVQVVLTRSEDFASTNPAPGTLIDLKIGAAADGELLALEARILLDEGAFADFSAAPFAVGRIGGPYRWKNWNSKVYGVRTNRVGSGAYRAPTAPQTAFALESLVDELAARLEVDPVDLRLRNAAVEGDRRVDGALWPGLGLREVLEAAKAHPLWSRRATLPENEGIGIAAGLFPGAKMAAGAVCRMDADGGVTVVTGSVDMSGTDTAMATIASEILGLDRERVRVVSADTANAPQAPISGGSTVTYSQGSAVRAASEDAREQLLRIAAEELEIAPEDLEIDDGVIRPVGTPSRGVTFEEIGMKVTGFGTPYPPVEGHGRTLPDDIAPSAAAHIAHVRVDPESGAVRVLAYVSVQDVGRALNRALCEGQMHGGAAQAIGWALCEQLEFDESGQLMTPSFVEYGIPSSEDVPPIETVIVEVPAPHGPLGAKGIGESAVVPGPAAVANAVTAATGKRFRELPMTPERVWRALNEAPA
jgi:CO/xanthine dehydrogenase Mo-binding subunit